MRKFRKRRALRFLFRFYFDLVFSSLPFFHAFLVLSFVVSVFVFCPSFFWRRDEVQKSVTNFFFRFLGGRKQKKNKKKTNDGLWNGRGLFSRERERERKREKKKRRRAPSPSLRRVLQLQKRKEWDESPRAFTQTTTTTTTTTTVAVVVRVSMIPTMENGRKD